MISLRTHNIIDYLCGAVIVAAPFLFGMADIPTARTALMVLGLAQIAYSLLTNYSLSIAKIFSVRTHMTLDLIVGLLVLLGPWLFGYRAALSGGQVAAHIIVGLIPILLASIATRAASEIQRETEEKKLTTAGRR